MRHFQFWLRILFVIGCLAFLAIGLAAGSSAGAHGHNEQRFTAMLGTMMLGFPTAFFGAGFLSDQMGSSLFNVAGSPHSFVRDWAIAAALGYAQWFLVMSFVLRAIRRLLGNRKSDSADSNAIE